MDLYRKAQDASKAGNFDYAINLAKTLVTQVPDHLEVRRLLRANEIVRFKKAGALARSAASLKSTPHVMKGKGALKKDPLAAMVSAEDALEVDPYSAQANQLLAEAAQAAQLMDIAILAHETLREGKPEDIDNLKKLADLYMQMNQPQKAQGTFEQVRNLKPTDGEAIKGIKDASAMLASSQGNWEQGSDYRESLKNADEARKLEQEKRVVRSSEAIDEQIAPLAEQYNQDNNNLNVVKQLAELYERKGDMATALSWYQWAHHVGGGIDPLIERKISDLQLGSIESLLKEKTDALAQTPDPAQQGILQGEVEQLKQQEAEFKLAAARERVSKYPNERQLRYELGELMVLAGRYKEALPELQQAINQPAVRVRALNMLGTCYWKSHMPDLAVKQFLNAESELPGMDGLKKEIIYNSGCLYTDMGKKDEALEQFKKIYEVDYHYRDVAQRVENAYTS
jgi:tetratricopeptide (TPR) repeat protein